MKKIIFPLLLLLTLQSGIFASLKVEAASATEESIVETKPPVLIRVAVENGEYIVIQAIETATQGWTAKIISGGSGAGIGISPFTGGWGIVIAIIIGVGKQIIIPIIWDKTKWVIGNWLIENKEYIAEVMTAVWENSKWVIKKSWDGTKWVLICHTNAVTGATVGGTIGGVSGSILGGAIGGSLATASCLASIGLSVGTFGATTLLSVGVCGTAIAAGTMTGTLIGAGGGAAVGTVGGAYLGRQIDDVNSCSVVKE